MIINPRQELETRKETQEPKAEIKTSGLRLGPRWRSR